MPKKPQTINLPDQDEAKKAIYACLACKSIFKEPGMCPDCNAVLKKRAG